METKTNKLGLGVLAFGHMVTDMQTGSLAVLIPLLYVSFKLDYATAALIITLNSITSSVIQPVFGLISDKFSLRWLLPLGCLLTGCGMVLVLFMPSYWLVLLVVIVSGLGAASFHPEGSRNANYVSGKNKASAMSVFFVGGNIGQAVGPIAATLLLGLFGPSGAFGMLIPCAIGTFLLWRMLPVYAHYAAEGQAQRRAARAAASTTAEPEQSIAKPLAFLLSIITVRSMISTGLILFIPLYFASLPGSNKEYAAFLLSVFLFCGAVGTLLGGRIADRFDRRLVMAGSLALVTPMLLIFLNSSGIVQVVALGIAGGALISTSTLTVVMAQALLPNRVGLASGLTLGLTFGAGGIGATALGKYADAAGIGQSMVIIALLPLVVVALSLAMPSSHKPAKIEPEPAKSELVVSRQG